MIEVTVRFVVEDKSVGKDEAGWNARLTAEIEKTAEISEVGLTEPIIEIDNSRWNPPKGKFG